MRYLIILSTENIEDYWRHSIIQHSLIDECIIIKLVISLNIGAVLPKGSVESAPVNALSTA